MKSNLVICENLEDCTISLWLEDSAGNLVDHRLSPAMAGEGARHLLAMVERLEEYKRLMLFRDNIITATDEIHLRNIGASEAARLNHKPRAIPEALQLALNNLYGIVYHGEVGNSPP